MKIPLILSLLAVALGGAIGAVCRFGVGVAVARWNVSAVPLGTLFVNVVGCLLIGALMPWFNRADTSILVRQLLITGFCGALTTFSTFGYETLLLTKTASRPDLALIYIGANLVLGLGAVWLGGWIVEWLVSDAAL